MRKIAPLVDYKTFITLSKLTRPFLMKTEGLEVRNAVAATKLAGIRAFASRVDSDRTAVALYGSYHGNGSNLWDDSDKQHQVIQKSVEGAAASIGKEASMSSTKISKTFKTDA